VWGRSSREKLIGRKGREGKGQGEDRKGIGSPLTNTSYHTSLGFEANGKYVQSIRLQMLILHSSADLQWVLRLQFQGH
jgi:hypothetical protein